MIEPMTAAPREAILEPALPIIDPHHHLWDRPAAAADLPPPRHGFERMLRRVPRYLLDELLADMKRGHNVIATVYMECGSMYRARRQLGSSALRNCRTRACANATSGARRSSAMASFESCRVIGLSISSAEG